MYMPISEVWIGGSKKEKFHDNNFAREQIFYRRREDETFSDDDYHCSCVHIDVM